MDDKMNRNPAQVGYAMNMTGSGTDGGGTVIEPYLLVNVKSPASGAILTGNPPAVSIPVVAEVDSSGAKNIQVYVQINTGTWQTATQVNATDWAYTAQITQAGIYTITAKATGTVSGLARSPTSKVTVTVQVVDILGPTLQVTSPASDGMITGASLTATGTALDDYSGVQNVDWSLDGQPFQNATALTAGWATWSASILVPLGVHTITFRATDKATPTPNTTTVARKVTLGQAYSPTDWQDNVSAIAYLGDMLKFALQVMGTPTAASTRVLAGTNPLTPLTQNLLKSTLYQPFEQLTAAANKTIANQPVHQLRLCIEVLRRYLSANPLGTAQAAQAAALAVAESQYRLAAYSGLLVQLGTSYEALRLARQANDASRQGLADRLGIDVSSLSSLLLSSNAQITETALENLFGLANTGRDPFAAASTPQLLTWQRNRLRQQWSTQDCPSNPDSLLPPIVEPDLISPDDFRLHLPNQALNPAFQIWLNRKAWIDRQLAQLRDDVVPGESDHTRLERLVGAKITSMANLLSYDLQNRQGNNIDSSLAAVQLSYPAFAYLIRMHQLTDTGTGTGTLLDSEWADVYSILVQVQKLRLYSSWRTEEGSYGTPAIAITLSPDYFLYPPAVAPEHINLYSTGLDANGAPLPEGAVDCNWSIVATPTNSATNQSAYLTNMWAGTPWLANSTTSRWISPRPDAATGDAAGTWVYRTTFDLTGYDPTTAQISMQVAADNQVTDVKLNGQSLGLGMTGYAPFVSLAINRGFTYGVNTLECIVSNWTTAANPTGLRVELTITAAPTSTDLPAWRATATARREWQRTLASRVAQDASLADALATAVDATEAATLPSLRAALLTALAGNRPVDVFADWLAGALLIDTQSSGEVKTTRVDQALETLQGMFFGLRLQRFKQMLPSPALANWTLNEDLSKFDEQWTWMGSYANWRAATFIFLYPENALLPGLSVNPTNAFKVFLDDVRNASGLRPAQASAIVIKYRDALAAELTSSSPPPQDPNLIANSQILKPTLTEGERATLRDYTKTQLQTYGNLQMVPAYLTELFYGVPMQLALQFQKSGQYATALDWLRRIYAYSPPAWPYPSTLDARKIYYGLNIEHGITSSYDRAPQWLLSASLNPHTLAGTRVDAYTRFTIMTLVRTILDYADQEFTIDTGETVARARDLYLTALDLLKVPDMSPVPKAGFVPNQIPAMLQRRAELSLFRLRSGHNIAGMQRQLPSYSSTAQGSGAAVMSAYGTITVPSATPPPPTPYRYSTLIERAKQLVNIAQQMEASYLSVMEKTEAEGYTLTRAQQDLAVAKATVDLHQLRVTEATDGVTLAGDQKDRAQFQVDHYQTLLDNGVTKEERLSLRFMRAEIAWQGAAATAYGTAAIAGLWSENPVASFASGIGQTFSTLASAAGTGASLMSAIASYERRAEEWQFQHDLTLRDVRIAGDQITIAQDHLEAVKKEQAIAKTQQDNAQDMVNYLATKFFNAELYQWMVGVLKGVYSYFLQQATATARLAENQLAFERQEPPLSVIQSDYWQIPAGRDGTTGSLNSSAPDRRGLTGSARLLQDVYRLDQYAFETNRRKLQLSKTFSLAQLAPIEFQRFRETGVLPFATTAEMFDRDFPGHYLRLIKRVRISVIALIPPTQGIRATLANGGVSRVTIGSDTFETVVVRRDPEMVALTSPMNATGLFELDTQPEMMLPFEALGVDTAWEFQMPRAANPFNYESVADVLITIEYTALNSYDLRKQVIRRLGTSISADRVYSFCRQFADQWYDLHNPDQTTTPMTVQFNTTADDFPPNVLAPTIKNIALYFVRADGATFEANVAHLSYTPLGGSIANGGAATSIDGVISIRRGNASCWVTAPNGTSVGMLGQLAYGQWELAFVDPIPAVPGSITARSLFQSEQIQDVLFVITYEGQTPPWPA